MIQAVPAKKPSSTASSVTTARLAISRDTDQHDPARGQREPEQPRPRHRQQEPRPAPHAERQPGEHRREQQAVAGVAATEVLDVDPGQPDDHAAGGEGPG